MKSEATMGASLCLTFSHQEFIARFYRYLLIHVRFCWTLLLGIVVSELPIDFEKQIYPIIAITNAYNEDNLKIITDV